jgi:hypothetical protein
MTLYCKFKYANEHLFVSNNHIICFRLPFQGTFRNGNGNYSSYSNGNGVHHLNGNGGNNGTLSSNYNSMTPGFPGFGTGSEWSLAMSPPPTEEAKYSLVRPKNLVERARLNVA